MEQFTILHLSDLHFKKRNDEDFLTSRDITQDRMISKINYHIKNNQEPDFVVVTGDIAFSGKEYKEAEEFFKKLCKIMSNSTFLVVPGNHDVDWDEIDEFIPPYNVVKSKLIDRFLESEKQIKKVIKPKFKGFRYFIDKFFPDLFDDKNDYYWVKNFEEKEVAFLGLNSCWACEGNDDRNHISLGFPQVIGALKKLRRYRIRSFLCITRCITG